MNQNYSNPPDHPGSPSGYEGRPVPPDTGTPRRMAVRTPQVRPTVTYSLLTITVVVYLLQMSSQYLLNGTDLPALFGMKANELIIQGHFWRLITPVLLHGSILHLGFNMYALFILGPMLERHYGHWPFLGLYLVSGFAGNVMSFLFSSAPSLGSSTAIFGLLGAQAVLLYQNRALFGPTAQRALINLITIAVINLVIGMSPGIDNWGHIGGLLAGTLFAWFGGPVLQVEGIYPELRVVNNRQTADTLRAGLSVVILFAALAVINVFLIME